jgi:hypothetical protein
LIVESRAGERREKRVKLIDLVSIHGIFREFIFYIEIISLYSGGVD